MNAEGKGICYGMKDLLFEIFQVKDDAIDVMFESLDALRACGKTVNAANYANVYAGGLPSTYEEDSLDKIFKKFNTDLPKYYRGRSMSVSDIVVIHNDESATAYFCDSFGWKEVPEFITTLAALWDSGTVETEGLWKTADERFLEVHLNSNDEWDITLYAKTSVDGGVLTDRFLDLEAAMREGARIFCEKGLKFQRVDHDLLENIQGGDFDWTKTSEN